MTVHFECWTPPRHRLDDDRVLDYDPDEGALCPECGERVTVYVETLIVSEVSTL